MTNPLAPLASTCVLQRYCKTHPMVLQLLFPSLVLLLLLMMMFGCAASVPHDVFLVEIDRGVWQNSCQPLGRTPVSIT